MTAQLWNADVERVLENMREKLHAKGAQQFSDLRDYFAQMDKKGEGLLVRREVEACLHFFGLFPTTQDIGTLMRMYGPHNGSTAQLAWQPFLAALEGELSVTRKDIIRQSYDIVIANCNNLSVAAIAALGRFDQHPLALNGTIESGKLVNEFAIGLGKAQDARRSAIVSYEVFETYYSTISRAFPFDEQFLAMMHGVWGAKGLKPRVQPPLFGGYKLDLIRKLEERTHHTEMPREVLIRALKKFDREDSGYLSPNEFTQAIQLFGFALTTSQMDDMYRCGETNKTGKLRIEWFADFIFT